MDNDDKDNAELVFSAKFACPHCGYSLQELEPRLFSFNNPMGACAACDGIGSVEYFDENGNLIRTAEEAKPIVVTYTDADPVTGAPEVWAAVSRDDGDDIHLGLRTPHDRSADALTHMWKSIRLRPDAVDAPFNTIRQRVEHEALSLELARRSGARVPALIGMLAVKNQLITRDELEAGLAECKDALDKETALRAYFLSRELISKKFDRYSLRPCPMIMISLVKLISAPLK